MSLSIGCSTLIGSPEEDRVYVERPVFPPDNLIKECKPIKPENPTAENVILIYKRTVDQCNTQLKSIRIWKEEQEQIRAEEGSD